MEAKKKLELIKEHSNDGVWYIVSYGGDFIFVSRKEDEAQSYYDVFVPTDMNKIVLQSKEV